MLFLQLSYIVFDYFAKYVVYLYHVTNLIYMDNSNVFQISTYFFKDFTIIKKHKMYPIADVACTGCTINIKTCV